MVRHLRKLGVLCLFIWLLAGEGQVLAAPGCKAGPCQEQTCERVTSSNVRKLKTEEEAMEHLRKYIVGNVKNGKNLVLKVEPNSRADGPGMWSIEIAAGEDHPDHFVTIAHYRVSSDGTIEELNIYTNNYENVYGASKCKDKM